MCGLIAGVSRSTPLQAQRFRSALNAIRHRGPDGQGMLLTQDRRVGLGHVRLATVDLQGGTQPIENETGTVFLVVNGEFYDDAKIRKDLEDKGHRFRSRSDSEIALHLYEEFGDAFVEYLRGEFALVLWDGTRRRLIAVRDRFGIKPLFWSEVRDQVFFASEAKALFELGVEPRWDRKSFLHAATHQYLPPSRSLFAGVKCLPPGCVMTVEDHLDHPKTKRYWDLRLPPFDKLGAPYEDQKERVFSHLEQAVKLRLRGDVPIGVYLSGGLDSASIAAVAQQHSPTPLRCFGVAFEDTAYDESEAAAEIAASIGAEFQSVRVSQCAVLETLPKAVYFSEGLAINGQLSAKFLLAQAVMNEGLKVVLTGEGADEAFFGYPHLVQDWLKTSAAQGLDFGAGVLEDMTVHNRASVGIMLPDESPPSLPMIEAKLGFVPTWLEAKSLLGLRLGRLLNSQTTHERSSWDPFEQLLGELDIEGQLQDRSHPTRSAWLWTKVALPAYILKTLGDGTEMASSIEGRTPYLDHRLFELAAQVPPHLKIKNGLEKSILRDALRPLLPPKTVRRRKHPFLAPPVTRFEAQRIASIVQDTLRGNAFASIPFFDRAKVYDFLDRLPSLAPKTRIGADAVLMMLLSCAAIQTQFRMGDP